ncbi:MAG: hypothetical protein MI866_16915 [Bacteroidales bacterium]|nr:hypothetical protein [Bacteroidales bacterium]
MDEKSIRRGYLTGILVMAGIILIGYFLNSIIGILGLVSMIWPQNLYFIVLLTGIGLTLGLMSKSLNKTVTDVRILLPSVIALGILATIVLIKPNGLENGIVSRLLATPALFLSVFVFVGAGAFISAKLRSFKKNWSQILALGAFLLFCYATVVSQHDYYQLSMRIGVERTLFEAEDDNGKYYRLPFAVKLMPNEDGLSKSMVRIFNTVDDFMDVRLSSADNYRLKGWDIRLNENSDASSSEQVDLKLVFDRWIELKYISCGLLIISLLIRLKY